MSNESWVMLMLGFSLGLLTAVSVCEFALKRSDRERRT